MSRPAAVVLAAGRSSRMGQPKANLLLGTSSMVMRLKAAYDKAGVEVWFVEGDVSITADVQVLRGVPGGEMIDSLAAAITALPDDISGLYVQPVDAPFTNATMIKTLGQPSHPAVLTFGGARGHPVWVPQSLFAAIGRRPQGGLRTLLDDAQQIAWPGPEILADLDTPADVASWRKEWQEQGQA